MYVSVFIRLMTATGIGYFGSCQGYALTAMHKLTPQIPVLLITTLTTVTVGIWFIPGRGLDGAADVCIISACVQAIGGALVLSREMRKKFKSPGVVTPVGDSGQVLANQASQ
jgi:hypothetical protein